MLDGNFNNQSRKTQLLTKEEELELICKWQDDKDYEARDKLIGSFIKWGANFAAGHARKIYANPDEAMSWASIGLMKAADKFDRSRGVRFSTYAQPWIRASVQEGTRSERNMVRMLPTHVLKKLESHFQTSRRKIENRAFNDDEKIHEKDLFTRMAEDIGVAARYVEIYNAIKTGDYSLNARFSDDDGALEWVDTVEDEEADHVGRLEEYSETSWKRELLADAFNTLNDRECDILVRRKLREEPVTLETLSGEYGVSRERIRQIEVKAFEKLQKAVRSAASDSSRENALKMS